MAIGYIGKLPAYVICNTERRVAAAALEIVGLIGPNGSGKTTFFNVVTGICRPDAGRIVVDGADITGASPQAVYHAGVSRTFQRSRLSLPIFDNIMIGNHKRLRQDIRFNLVRRAAFKAERDANWRTTCELVEVLEPLARSPVARRRQRSNAGRLQRQARDATMAMKLGVTQR